MSCLLPQYTNLVLYRQYQIHCHKSPKLSICTYLAVRQVQPISGFVPMHHSTVLSNVQMYQQILYELAAQYSILGAHIVGSTHLDLDQWATKAHSTHLCNICGRLWDQPKPQVQGNPLAVFGLHFHGNRLLFLRTVAGGEAQSLIIEMSWLGLTYQGQQDAADIGRGRILAQICASNIQLLHGLCMGLNWFIGHQTQCFVISHTYSCGLHYILI